MLGKEDWFKIEEWHVAEGDIVQADKPLVTIECALASFSIPIPPQADTYRVKRLCVPAGASTHLGELIVVLEQSMPDTSSEPSQGKSE
jgi:pyruvate/2-oxoglutarate dehydrogenase complex dihydrolipoamide acyltransferase (E2) component